MNEDELAGLLLMIGVLVVLVFVILALTAGNIVNQLLGPVPSVAGPLGAAAALIVFIFLLTKAADLLFG